MVDVNPVDLDTLEKKLETLQKLFELMRDVGIKSIDERLDNVVEDKNKKFKIKDQEIDDLNKKYASLDKKIKSRVTKNSIKGFVKKADLTGLAKTSDLPDLSSYQTQLTDLETKINSLTGGASSAQIQALKNEINALESNIPDLNDYFTKTEVQDLIQDFIKNSDLSDYAKKSDLPSINDYLTKDEINARIDSKIDAFSNGRLKNVFLDQLEKKLKKHSLNLLNQHVNDAINQFAKYVKKDELEGEITSRLPSDYVSQAEFAQEINDITNSFNNTNNSVSDLRTEFDQYKTQVSQVLGQISSDYQTLATQTSQALMDVSSKLTDLESRVEGSVDVDAVKAELQQYIDGKSFVTSDEISNLESISFNEKDAKMLEEIINTGKVLKTQTIELNKKIDVVSAKILDSYQKIVKIYGQNAAASAEQAVAAAQ